MRTNLQSNSRATSKSCASMTAEYLRRAFLQFESTCFRADRFPPMMPDQQNTLPQRRISPHLLNPHLFPFDNMVADGTFENVLGRLLGARERSSGGCGYTAIKFSALRRRSTNDRAMRLRVSACIFLHRRSFASSCAWVSFATSKQKQRQFCQFPKATSRALPLLLMSYLRLATTRLVAGVVCDACYLFAMRPTSLEGAT